jgi:hypothetical protein
MFKNYLTYTLAQSFHRTTCSIEMPSHESKERLLRSSENLIHHFARSIHTQDPKEESKFFAVALICLRDCKDTLEEFKTDPTHEIFSQYTLLHGRLEQLCLDAATSEGGQMRMLG